MDGWMDGVLVVSKLDSFVTKELTVSLSFT
jgi:hypothetical protein